MFKNEIISAEDKKKAIGKIYKAYLDYRARESEKRKLNAKRDFNEYLKNTEIYHNGQ